MRNMLKNTLIMSFIIAMVCPIIISAETLDNLSMETDVTEYAEEQDYSPIEDILYEEKDETSDADEEKLEINENKAYDIINKEVSVEENGSTIVVSGDMPVDAEVVVSELDDTQIETAETLVEGLVDERTFVNTLGVYDIKVLDSEGDEFQPEDYDSVLNVKFSGLDVEISDNKSEYPEYNKRLVIYHIKDENSITEMETSTDDEENVSEASCDTESFSWFLIGEEYILDDSVFFMQPITNSTQKLEIWVYWSDNSSHNEQDLRDNNEKLTAVLKVVEEGRKGYFSNESGTSVPADTINKSWNKYVNKLVVEEGVKYIPDHVFRNIGTKDDPVSVTFADTVEIIREGAFVGSFLDSVDVSGLSISSLGESAFSGCTFTNTPTLNFGRSSFEIIGNNTFYGVSGVDRIVIPDAVTELGADAFAYSSFYDINVHEGITNIGEDCFFRSNENLYINIPSSVETVGEHAFTYSGISNIELDLSSATWAYDPIVNTSGYGMFSGTRFNNIAKIIVEKDVPVCAFGNSKYRGSGTIILQTKAPLDQEPSIGAYAFFKSELPISSIDGFTGVSSCAFVKSACCITGIGSVRSLAGGDVTAANTDEKKLGAFGGCYGITSLTIDRDKLSSDGIRYEFNYCTNLTSVSFVGATNTAISHSFNRCPKLTTVIDNSTPAVEVGTSNFCETPFCNNKYTYGSGSLEGHTFYSGVDGVTQNYADYDWNTDTLTITGTMECPASVRPRVKHVVFLSTSVGLGKGYFSNCPELLDVKFAGTYSFNSINGGGSCFANCSKLRTVTGTLTSMGMGSTGGGQAAFSGCSSLITVTMSDNLSVISEDCFRGCTSLDLAKLPDNLIQIYDYAFYDCRNLTLTDLPVGSNQLTLYASAFSGCPNVRINMHDSRTIISYGKFNGLGFGEAFIHDEGSELTGIENCTFDNKNIKLYTKGIKNNTSFNISNCNIEELELSGADTTVTGVSFSSCFSLSKIVLDGYKIQGTTTINKYGCPFVGDDGIYYDTLPGGTEYNVTLRRRDNEEWLGTGVIGIYDKAAKTYHIKKVQTSSGNFSANSYRTPGEYHGYGYVTNDTSNNSEVGYYPFSEELYAEMQNTVESVIYDDEITKVERGSFYNFPNLKELDLGSGVKTISVSAFALCPKLAVIRGGDSVTTIETSSISQISVLNPKYDKLLRIRPFMVTENMPLTIDDNASSALKNYDWAAVNRVKPSPIRDISYGFENFGEPVNQDIFYYMYGNNSLAEAYIDPENPEKTIGGGGNCYGMAMTAALLYVPNSVNVSDFSNTEIYIRNLKKTDLNNELLIRKQGINSSISVKDFIQVMHVAQCSSLAKENSNYIRATDDNYSEKLYQMYQKVENETKNGKPVSIGVYGPDGGGHRVLAYGVDNISDNQKRILIYDSNYPLVERDIKLNKDAGGWKWSFEFQQGDEWGTGKSYESIDYSTYDGYSKLWDNRGNLENDGHIAFVTNIYNLKIYSNNNLVATLTNGHLETQNDNIWVSGLENLRPGSAINTSTIVINLPVGKYTLERTNPSEAEEWIISYANVELGGRVKSKAKKLSLLADDKREITQVEFGEGTTDEFEIELRSSKDNESDVTIKASKADKGGVVQMQNGQYSTSNVDVNEETIYFTIYFDAQGGSDVSPITNIKQNNKVKLPSTTKNAFTFGGWYTQPNGKGTKYTDSTPINKNLTLYAYWIKKKNPEKTLITSIAVNPTSSTIKKGSKVALNVTILPSNATNKDISWTSSNSDVASVSSTGLVKGIKAGSTIITCSSKDGSNKFAKCTINVIEPSMKLNTSKLVIQKGRTNKKVKVIIKDDKIDTAKSNKKNVVTVKVKGNTLQITGKKVGKATITVVSKSGIKKKLNVTVQKDKVITKTLKVSKSTVKIKKGKSAAIKVTATPDSISTGEKIKISTSKKGIVSYKIDQNAGAIKITGKKKGTCKLTVKVGKKSKKISVKVTK